MVQAMCLAQLFLFFVVSSALVTAYEYSAQRQRPHLFRRSAARVVSPELYPEARRNTSVVDDYHGTKVADPYRWMEDPDSAETASFIQSQNALSEPFLQACPVRGKLTERLREAMNYSRYKCPKRAGDKYYYFHNTGLQNQDVMYVQDSLESEASVFLDPNLLSEDGTVSMSGMTSFSRDGSLFAYGLSTGGSDWVTIKVKQAPSGEDLSDTLHYVKFSYIAWTPDNAGFFYSRYPEESGSADGADNSVTLNHKVYYHVLGTNQTQDILVYHLPDHPGWSLLADMSDDDDYLILTVLSGASTVTFYVADLRSLEHGITGPLDPIKLIDDNNHASQYVTNVGTQFIVQTNIGAAFNKISKIDIRTPQYENWVTLVEENPDRGLLNKAVCVNNKLVLHYVHEAKSELYVHNLQTGEQEHQVDLNLGSVNCMEGRHADTELFFDFQSYLYPGRIIRLNMTTYDTSVVHESRVPGFQSEMFETKQLFYTSYDGTRVPMFVVHKKNVTLSGDHPVLLYGYGGFRVTITPWFDVGVAVFLQHLSGIYAVANIRGGSEYGEGWHVNGSLGNKQNVFDDFQAAAEFLIDSNYTNTKKIAINGASNGGLLVAACLNQRPDLFAAGIPEVGVLDMLRFQLFTIGYAWVPEYGSSDDPQQFTWLYSYSPLHNIPCHPVGGQYPATLVRTADKDDRVAPLHSLKFIAELQHTMANNPNQTNPLLIRVDTNAGHGAGKPTSKVLVENVEKYSFLYSTLGLKWHSERSCI